MESLVVQPVVLKKKKHERDPEDMGNLPGHLEGMSRTLARILRHAAPQVGIRLHGDAGWCRLDNVLQLPDFKSFSEGDVEEVVRESYSKDRPRFELKLEDGFSWIRATHKHTTGAAGAIAKAERAAIKALEAPVEPGMPARSEDTGQAYSSLPVKSELNGSGGLADAGEGCSDSTAEYKSTAYRDIQRGPCSFGDQQGFSHRKGHQPRIVPPRWQTAPGVVPPRAPLTLVEQGVETSSSSKDFPNASALERRDASEVTQAEHSEPQWPSWAEVAAAPSEVAAAPSEAAAAPSTTKPPWQKFQGVEDQGCWWWLEETNEWFMEDSPGDWTRYVDPETTHVYWWRDDENWFWQHNGERDSVR